MTERLIKFMNEENLTSTRLAEIAGVQPSAISHILSGRNKPGFDFLSKLSLHYPSLDIRWLLTGAETHEKKENRPVVDNQTEINLPVDLFTGHKNEKEIAKIIIFYDDKSFDVYNSGK